ncbi:MAG: hypothetical protein NVS1B6_01210 [Steroidobacteraceae bacterium]
MSDDVTDEQIALVMRELGRRGGLAKVPKGTAALTPEERSERGRMAAKARWAKRKKGAKKKSPTRGTGPLAC